jgi:hypothetical protein
VTGKKYDIGSNHVLMGSANIPGTIIGTLGPGAKHYDIRAADRLNVLLTNKDKRDSSVSRYDFTYDHERDIYLCPGGRVLTTTGTLVNDGTTVLYRASRRDCGACPLKPRCCPKEPARKIPRSVYEGARDMAREIAKSWQGKRRVDCAKGSRCCSRISNASSSWIGFDYKDRMALVMSSSSLQPPRTSANWPS